MDIVELLKKVVDGKNLSIEESYYIAHSIIRGNVSEVLTVAILIALRMKEEIADEIIGFAKAMREMSIKINAPNAIDVVGTGGDGFGTINVSTASALLVSILHPVAKHGNRAVSGRSGSADFLEAIGYKIEVEPHKAEELLKKTNFVFLYAPLYHPSMKNVAPIRKTLRVRTIFNLLGPLTNPGGTKRQVVGVALHKYINTIAEAIQKLDFEKVILVHGEPGIDEVSPQGRTYIVEVSKTKIDSYVVEPEDFGVSRFEAKEVLASSPEESAIKVLKAVLGRERAVASFIKMNAAVAFYLLDKAKDLKDGYELADQILPMMIDKIKELIIFNGDEVKFNALLGRAL